MSEVYYNRGLRDAWLLADEQNKEVAINFAEWIRLKGWKPDGLRTWTRKIADKPLEVKNTNKLYQEFLNQKP